MYFKPEEQSLIYECYPDTGADFEIINQDLVKELGLKIQPPAPNELTHIRLANKSIIPRIGFVMLSGTIIFSGEDNNYRVPMKITKKFEVMPCEHSFLFGTGILPSIFKGDEIMKYLAGPSSITDPPTIYMISYSNDYLLKDHNHHKRRVSFPSVNSITSTNNVDDFMRLESRHVYSSSTDGMSLEVSLSNPDTSSSSSSSKD